VKVSLVKKVEEKALGEDSRIKQLIRSVSWKMRHLGSSRFSNENWYSVWNETVSEGKTKRDLRTLYRL